MKNIDSDDLQKFLDNNLRRAETLGLAPHYEAVVEALFNYDVSSSDEISWALKQVGDEVPEIAESIQTELTGDELTEWAETAISEFGWEGVGESIRGAFDMASYVYDRQKAAEVIRLFEDELIGEFYEELAENRTAAFSKYIGESFQLAAAVVEVTSYDPVEDEFECDEIERPPSGDSASPDPFYDGATFPRTELLADWTMLLAKS